MVGSQLERGSTARMQEPRARPWRTARSERLLVGAIILAGVGIQTWIAVTNVGVQYDTDTATIVARLLASHPLHAYVSLRYPYPSGYFPLLLVCRWLAEATGIPFWATWKFPAILADAALSLVLVWHARQWRSAGSQVTVAALVSLGPIFVIVAGYHGQLDPVAILPAVIALVVWERGGPRRGLAAGLLIGVGTAIKTLPLFMVLVLLPTARSRREAATVIAAALAVPLLALAPFLIATPHDTLHSLTSNHGVPGLGGLSMLIQPGLTDAWLHGRVPDPSSATLFFTREQNLIVLVAALAAGAYALYRRVPAVPAALLVWCAVYVSNVNWAYQYFLWGLPFLALARRVRVLAVIQALLLLPAAEAYFHFAVASFGWAYIPLLMVVWAGFAAGIVLLVRAAQRGAFRPAAATPA